MLHSVVARGSTNQCKQIPSLQINNSSMPHAVAANGSTNGHKETASLFVAWKQAHCEYKTQNTSKGKQSSRLDTMYKSAVQFTVHTNWLTIPSHIVTTKKQTRLKDQFNSNSNKDSTRTKSPAQAATK